MPHSKLTKSHEILSLIGEICWIQKLQMAVPFHPYFLMNHMKINTFFKIFKKLKNTLIHKPSKLNKFPSQAQKEKKVSLDANACQ